MTTDADSAEKFQRYLEPEAKADFEAIRALYGPKAEWLPKHTIAHVSVECSPLPNNRIRLADTRQM
jgi:hypothetical protein